MSINRFCQCLLLVTLSAAVVSTSAPARAIVVIQSSAPTVTVNGETLDFQGQPPVERQGHLLVPLRGIFERLGAFVDYDAFTKTVNALRGKTSIALTVGERQAQVNGKTLFLDSPAQLVRGTVLVPLRFVAESLGAKVFYDAPNNTVAIRTNSAPAPSLPNTPDNSTSPSALEEVTVSGTVVAVYADLEPRRLVIRPRPGQNTTGEEKTIPLFPDTLVQLRRDNTNSPFSFNRITPGDNVTVHEAADGVAISIDVLSTNSPTRPKPTPPGPRPNPRPKPPVRPNPPDPNVFKGELTRVDKLPGRLYLLTMTDGRVVAVPENVPIAYDGQSIRINELRSGDRLTINLDPNTKRGKKIVIAY